MTTKNKTRLKPEPLLRVGIILPEDRVQKIDLVVPGGAEFIFDDAPAIKKSTMQCMDVAIKQGDKELLSVRIGKDPEIQVSSVKICQPEQRCHPGGDSIQVRNVVAGRNFHWKKHVDVNLPGDVEVRITDRSLILINTLLFEYYVACVATSEMSATCPAEFIMAQTVAARSWMLANVEKKHLAMGMDVCNDDCCQRYQGMKHLTAQSLEGAKRTAGQVLMHGDKICDARYSKSCGGVIESFEGTWEGGSVEYLIAKPDTEDANSLPDLTTDHNFAMFMNQTSEAFCGPKYIDESSLKKYLGHVDEGGAYFRWDLVLKQDELITNLAEKCGIAVKAVQDLVPLKRGRSGRILQLKVIYQTISGELSEIILHSEYAIRESLHANFLYSSAFHIEKACRSEEAPAYFSLRGGGWGHGVGLCQIGALGMAMHGYKMAEILVHYFPNTHLEKVWHAF